MVVYGSLMFKPLWAKFFIKLSHLLLCLSSAVNIIIYSYKVCNFTLQCTVKQIPMILGFSVQSCSDEKLRCVQQQKVSVR